MTNQERTYQALRKAAEQIGKANYRSQLRDHVRKGRSPNTFRFHVTRAHKELVEAMPKVASGEWTAEQGMALLHYGETGYELSQAREDAA